MYLKIPRKINQVETNIHADGMPVPAPAHTYVHRTSQSKN